jgi:copper resistance protein B
MIGVCRSRVAFALASVVVAQLGGVVSTASAQDPHAGHQQHAAATQAPLPPFIPPLTDEDRRAAFPDLPGHAVHDSALRYFVLFDQLEWQSGNDASGLNVDARGWMGGDRNRLWFRSEGSGDHGRLDDAQAHLLFGRQFSRWWDVVAGIRQDLRPGSPQTWAAFGVQGLAPYRFDIEATAYVGASGRTHARFEVEYELLVSNRLVLQPLVEAEVVGKSDPTRSIGAGLSTTDAGFRLRYEIKRELAPYVGVTWSRKWGTTGDLAEAAGEDRGGARLVTGVRLWF